MTSKNERLIDEIIAATFPDAHQKPNGGAGVGGTEQDQQDAEETEPAIKPTLIVHSANYPMTAEAVRDLIAGSPGLQVFNRGGPVYIPKCGPGEIPEAARLTISNVIRKVHDLRQPAYVKSDGSLSQVTLPERIARMYLEMEGEHSLRPLTGICTSPILAIDGDIRVADGYDDATGLWCSNVPDIKIADKPTKEQAEAALRVLRDAFKTFPFADAERRWDEDLKADVVDLSKDPKLDESAFLVGLLTTVCRQSLRFAPGLVLSAASISGAGSGKGLLVRSIAAVAYDLAPSAVPRGDSIQELDKRIVAELIKGHPVLFLDNINGTRLESATLASIMTERPVRLRQLGESKMIELDSAVFVMVTGNGLTVSEDLVRRFLVCDLDARVEDPEQRKFAPGFLAGIKRRRPELLAACLTIWRWGQLDLMRDGKPLGGFEEWCEWVRDPLLTLGCADPVERLHEIKARDPKRQRVTEIYATWFEHHKSAPVKVSDLAEEVVAKISGGAPMTRQRVATEVGKLEGTRAGGFVLTREKPKGKWSPSTYRLEMPARQPESPATAQDGESIGGHRGHRGGNGNSLGESTTSNSETDPYGDHGGRHRGGHREGPSPEKSNGNNALDGDTSMTPMVPYGLDTLGQAGDNPADPDEPFDLGPDSPNPDDWSFNLEDDQ
jgi:hypothetical protein